MRIRFLWYSQHKHHGAFGCIDLRRVSKGHDFALVRAFVARRTCKFARRGEGMGARRTDLRLNLNGASFRLALIHTHPLIFTLFTKVGWTFVTRFTLLAHVFLVCVWCARGTAALG